MKDQLISTIVTMFLHYLQISRIDLVDREGKRITPESMFDLRDSFAKENRDICA